MSRRHPIRSWRLAVALLLLAGEAPAAEPSQAMSIVFVGDIMLAGAPDALIERGIDPFAGVADVLKAADLRVGNLECVVATIGSPMPGKPHTFRASPRSLESLRRHFDVVTLANNHSGDFGPAAFAQMLDLLDAAGIGHVGGGHDLEGAHRPQVVQRNGLRVALLGYNEYAPRSFEADVDRPGIAWSEDEDVRRDIEAARELADVVIPVMHWGQEYDERANRRQRALARLMIDAGADAVVGGHPHVVQDVEDYRGKPIVYSLGNFVFDGFDTPQTTMGWMLRLDLDLAGVRSWQIQPVSLGSAGAPRVAGTGTALCWRRGAGIVDACGEAPEAARAASRR